MRTGCMPLDVLAESNLKTPEKEYTPQTKYNRIVPIDLRHLSLGENVRKQLTSHLNYYKKTGVKK